MYINVNLVSGLQFFLEWFKFGAEGGDVESKLAPDHHVKKHDLLLCELTSGKSAKKKKKKKNATFFFLRLMSWSHPNLKFVFSGLSDLFFFPTRKAMRVENAASTPPFPNPFPPHRCLTLHLLLPVSQFGKAPDLPVQLPR